MRGWRQALRHRLSVQQAITAAVVGVLLGVVLSASQIVIDFLDERNRVAQTAHDIMEVMRETATKAVFNIDDELARSVVDGIFRNPLVWRAYIETDAGTSLASRSRPTEGGVLSELINDYLGATDGYYLTLRVIRKGENAIVGKLAIFIDQHLVLAGFGNRALMVMAAGLVRNLAFSLLLSFAFIYTLTRPIQALTASAEAIDLEHPASTILMVPAEHQLNELGQLAGVLNRVLVRLDQTIRRQAELIREVALDPLTGVSNRRHFNEVGAQLVAAAQRYRRPFAVALIDIDHFKRVNDQFGHQAGDEVIKAVASFCRRILRDSDLLARIGGEEFAILMPETPIESAIHTLDRLRKGMAFFPVQTAAGGIDFTVSVGLAACDPDRPMTLELLMERADQAMYEAKRLGRNRVITWRPAANAAE